MRKKIREIICALIPNKEARIKVRHFLGAIRPISDLKNLVAFCHTPIERNTVLIIETNECHGECLCSYLKYFKEAGYKTHLAVTPTIMQGKPLNECTIDIIPEKTFLFSPQTFYMFFKFTKKLKKYEQIFLCTSQNYYYGNSCISALKIQNDIQKKMVILEHDIRNIEKYNEKVFAEKNRLFVITNFEENPDIKTISPHYFPQIKPVIKFDTFKNFITIGALEKKRRNITLLYDVVEKLDKSGITNFKITVVGGGKITDLPKEISQYFEIKSKLNSPDMHKELLNAHYILPLLDPTLEANRDYFKYKTTGTLLLSLGFTKPCLINNKFAKTYNLDNANAILYDNNELCTAMKKAINLSYDDYSNLVANLEELSKKHFKTSLNNIKETLRND